ncbi:MAG: hypothetical protein LBV75_06180, partial [Paludibacter sp.]|nr:hypothetical protein [Paludibacter sp.]
MEIIDKNTFFELTRNFEIVPVTQTRGLYEMLAISGAKQIRFFVDDTKKIACFAHEKRFLGTKMLLIGDECYAEQTDFNNRK